MRQTRSPNRAIAYATNSLAVQITDQSPLRLTTLLQTGSVLNGPQGQPGAVGPTNTNDDYTNKSVNTGIAGVAPGGVTTAAGTVSFTNTVQNTGNANDSFTLTVTSFPVGATVVVNGVTVVLNGTATGTPVAPLAIAFGGSANYTVDVTLPLGQTVLTGYDTVIRATSANTSHVHERHHRPRLHRVSCGSIKRQLSQTRPELVDPPIPFRAQ